MFQWHFVSKSGEKCRKHDFLPASSKLKYGRGFDLKSHQIAFAILTQVYFSKKLKYLENIVNCFTVATICQNIVVYNSSLQAH